MPAIINRTQTAANAQRVENTIAELNKQINMIQRDINQRRVTDVVSAKQAMALKMAQIKELRQYTTQTPVNVRDQKNPYRTFNVPYTATAKIKPRAQRPRPTRQAPKKGSIQSKMAAQKNRLQQSKQARAPRASISKLPKPKTALVKPKRKVRRVSRSTRRMTRPVEKQRSAMRTRARSAMGPTRTKGNRKARAMDMKMSRSQQPTRGRSNTRANKARSLDQSAALKSRFTSQSKSLAAEQKRLQQNALRRKQEQRSITSQTKQKAKRVNEALNKNKQVKALKKTAVAKKLTNVRVNKAKVAEKKKKAKKKVSALTKRLRFGQANLGLVRRDERLAEEMRNIQYELAQAQHEDNQLAALFGQLAKEEAMLIQQLYADEENFSGYGSTPPRHERITRTPQSSSGRYFYDAREFNTYAHRIASDEAGVPTLAYKELVQNINNKITNGQFKSTGQAKIAFMQEISANRSKYFSRVLTTKQQAQSRQLGILTVQKNRMSKSAPDIRTLTAQQRAFYEQQRVAEANRTKIAEQSAEVEKQLAGFFPRTRSAMERMTR
jgi:hypothetical protein